MKQQFNKKDIKIFVSHRIDIDTEIIDDPLYINVRCGAMFDNRKNIFMQGDNTGDNISYKKESYCELTVQYWAWKNIEADYYGLCHYRRYFSFNEEEAVDDITVDIFENFINEKKIKKYRLDDHDYLEKILKEYDIIVSRPYEVTPAYKNLIEQYSSVKYLYKEHIDLMMDILKNDYPEYYQSAKNYMFSNKFISCNMFIMNKKLFNEYSEFLFGILEKLEKTIDMTKLSYEGKRLYGHLGERLLGIFINYKVKTIKVKYLQKIFFEHPKKIKEITQIKDNSINIVYSTTDYYVAYMYVSIISMLQYKKDDDFYHIIVFTANISEHNKKLLEELENYKPNVNVTVYYMGALIDGYEFKGNYHLPVETFFRLYIPIVLKTFGNAIYIDCDTIIKRNIVDIYQYCNLDYTINAVKDIEYIEQDYTRDDIYINTREVLKLKSAEQYFQGGVIVFNISLFRKKYSAKNLLDYAVKNDFLYLEQDAMNAFLKDDVNYIDMGWNCITDFSGEKTNNYRNYVPAYLYKEYIKAKKDPYIIHYAGTYEKPWNNPDINYANDFWEIARKTPFYEIILHRMAYVQSSHISFAKLDHFSRIMFPFKWLKKVHKVGYIRQIADKLLPHGTKRRKIIKKLLFG